MKTLENVCNHVKDGYLWCAEKVADHPHIVIAAWLFSIYLTWRFT